VTRRDWLILFISLEGAPRGLDPVRIQKGLFLFAEETARPAAEKYVFKPHNYGPMSPPIYTDVDSLVEDGLVESVPVEGQTWRRYPPTAAGIKRGRELLPEAIKTDATATEKLFDIKASVANMTFRALLEDVYDRYPEYAERSVFVRRA
jgi:uncharacterized protein YwgA